MEITLSEKDYRAATENYLGYCLACGAEKDGCEPDARRYECDECGKNQVYGAEELLLMGKITITE